MKNVIFYCAVTAVITAVMLGAAPPVWPQTRPQAQTPAQAQTPPQARPQAQTPPSTAIQTPPPETRIYTKSYMIMGEGSLTAYEMAAWLLSANPEIDADFARDFAQLYIHEAALEGVNHDVAFSQMCLETGFLRFDRLVKQEMNNFGGLGAVNSSVSGERFNTIGTGVRAQIQHLKAYASVTPLRQKLVDPRYYYVRYGSAPSIYDLSGKWAVDTAYGDKLKDIIDRAYYLAGKSPENGALTMAP